MPTFFVSMPAVVLLGLGATIAFDGGYVMGAVMIAISMVLFFIWSRMWARKTD